MYDAVVEVVNDNLNDAVRGRLTYRFVYVTEEWTDFQLAVKYFLFGYSFVNLIVMIKLMRPLPSTKMILEQKHVRNLSILLLFFNDPFFAFTIFSPWRLWSIISYLGIIAFVTYLMYSWLAQVQRASEGLVITTKIPTVGKFIFFFLFYTALILYSVAMMMEVDADPGFTYYEEKNQMFYFFSGLALLFVVIYVIWYLVSICITCRKRREMPPRHRFLFAVNIVCVFFMLIALLAGAFVRWNDEGAVYLFFGFFFNIYVTYMLILYAPSKESI